LVFYFIRLQVNDSRLSICLRNVRAVQNSFLLYYYYFFANLLFKGIDNIMTPLVAYKFSEGELEHGSLFRSSADSAESSKRAAGPATQTFFGVLAGSRGARQSDFRNESINWCLVSSKALLPLQPATPQNN
jgi:hypothetical protein